MTIRKDKKGKKLLTGESQRKDGRYMYRYADRSGKRKTIYANSLEELREKEQIVNKKGVSADNENMTIVDMVESYYFLKPNLKTTTARNNQTIFNIIKHADLGEMFVHDLKPIDLKKAIKDLYTKPQGEHHRPYSYGTISKVYGVIKHTFVLATEDEAIKKNPCNFALSDVIKPERKEKTALTRSQQANLLRFLQENPRFHKFYPTVLFLLETGLRSGEFLGLTQKDLDFTQRTVTIDHQLQKDRRRGPYIETPKSVKGYRTVPLSDRAIIAAKELLRQKQETGKDLIIDGRTGFINVTSRGKILVNSVLGHKFYVIQQAYNEAYPNDKIEQLSPHILRHTFCTNMLQRGMNPKALQYLMGHSSLEMTVNHYGHETAEHAKEEFDRIMGS